MNGWFVGGGLSGACFGLLWFALSYFSSLNNEMMLNLTNNCIEKVIMMIFFFFFWNFGFLFDVIFFPNERAKRSEMKLDQLNRGSEEQRTSITGQNETKQNRIEQRERKKLIDRVKIDARKKLLKDLIIDKMK